MKGERLGDTNSWSQLSLKLAKATRPGEVSVTNYAPTFTHRFAHHFAHPLLCRFQQKFTQIFAANFLGPVSNDPKLDLWKNGFLAQMNSSSTSRPVVSMNMLRHVNILRSGAPIQLKLRPQCDHTVGVPLAALDVSRAGAR